MNTFSILFYLKREKLNQKGLAPIYVKITINGKKSELSINRYVEPSRWNTSKGMVSGSKEDARTINHYIETVRIKINETHRQLLEKGKHLSAYSIKQAYLGKDMPISTLVGLFEFHNQQMQEKLGNGYALGTLKRFKATLNNLKAFIQYNYNTNDIPLKQLDYAFITSFEHYLKTIRTVGHNYATKNVVNTKKIVGIAIRNEWLMKDPFIQYKATYKETSRESLTEDELVLLEQLVLPSKKLEVVRDVFVFCCYTGLAHYDVKQLSSDNLFTGINGQKWIHVKRQKTGVECNVPLFSKAVALLNKYKEFPLALSSGKLLPVFSNQKTNQYLKKIAQLCGIKINLTAHKARHTFSMLALNNGMPIETISAILAHKNIRTTQIYAHTRMQKICSDMMQLQMTLESKRNKQTSNNYNYELYQSN